MNNAERIQNELTEALIQASLPDDIDVRTAQKWMAYAAAAGAALGALGVCETHIAALERQLGELQEVAKESLELAEKAHAS